MPTHPHSPEISLSDLAGKRVIVLGDVMLDSFVYGDCSRISPEAPIPVLLRSHDDVMLGGAGNVARNITALGGKAMLIAVAGNDAAGDILRAAIASQPGLEADLVSDGRPTTQKIRYVVGQQQMLRVDIEKCEPVDPQLVLKAFERHLPDADAVVLSDYGKGVLTTQLLARAIEKARALGKPVVADPKSEHVERYDGVTVLTPNAAEAARAAGARCSSDNDAHLISHSLLQKMQRADAVLVTRGPKGMTLARRGEEPIHFAALAREVFDVSGAGDTVVATLALALAAGWDLPRAAMLGNRAAGLVVSKPGTAVVTIDELGHELQSTKILSAAEKIASPDEVLADVIRWRREGKTIGFTNGCFDLIHPGHVFQLAQAREQCDHLVVGLNSDASIKRLKGPSRPVQEEAARAIVLASLASVDRVVIFEDDTPLALIEEIGPDVLIKGKDYSVDQVVGAEYVLARGGRVFLAEIIDGHSTTNTISRLLEGKK